METTIRIYPVTIWGGKLNGYPIQTASIAVINKQYFWQAATAKNSYMSTNAEHSLADAFIALKTRITK
jgi:hypothetical protein